MTLEQLQKNLDAKIPRSEVKTREGGGVTLDYLSSYYVIKRLNEVVGQGNWGYKTISLSCVNAGPFTKKNWKTKEDETHYSAHYIAQVELTVRLVDRTVSFMDVGYGDGTEKLMPGKAHELASKEAVTDALKRCAKNLGMSLGLALYDKEQENVNDEESTTVQAASTPTPQANANGNGSANSSRTVSESNAKQLIKQSFEVLNAKRATTKEKFVEQFLKPYGASKVDALDATQAATVLSQVKASHPELGL